MRMAARRRRWGLGLATTGITGWWTSITPHFPTTTIRFTATMGIAEPTIPFLGWGTAFLDFDNDGWKDIVIANGHVYPSVDGTSWGTTFAQRPLLFHNIEGKKFDLMPAVEGGGLANLSVGRGVGVGD